MTAAFLSSPVIAVGDVKATVAESAGAGRLVSDADALMAAGFRWHHMASSSTTAFDLAAQAVVQLDVDPDAIVYSTCLPANAALPGVPSADVKVLMDYAGSRLQERFGFDRAHVIGLGQQACTGLLGSIRIARSLLLAEPESYRTILCLTADRFPEGSLYEQAYNVVSDGAAACIVSSADGAPFRVVGSHHLTNGALAVASDDETVGSYFTWTHRLVTELLDRVGGSLDWVVPQNTNPAAWRILSRLLGIDAERVWLPSLPDIGHMISGDNVANLAELLDARVLVRGDRVLLVMAGYGMNWQATLLEFVG